MKFTGIIISWMYAPQYTVSDTTRIYSIRRIDGLDKGLVISEGWQHSVIFIYIKSKSNSPVDQQVSDYKTLISFCKKRIFPFFCIGLLGTGTADHLYFFVFYVSKAVFVTCDMDEIWKTVEDCIHLANHVLI